MSISKWDNLAPVRNISALKTISECQCLFCQREDFDISCKNWGKRKKEKEKKANIEYFLVPGATLGNFA